MASSLTFTGPGGADPVKHWIRLTTAAQPTVGDAILCGSILQGNIRRRTSQGVDVDNVPFAPYSEGYAKRKLKKLGRNSPVDLFGWGREHMLLALVTTVAGAQYPENSGFQNPTPTDSFHVGIFSADDAIIARARLHNEGGTVKTRLGTGKKTKSNGKAFATMPQRQFLAASTSDIEQMTLGVGQAMLARIKAAGQ